jgi:hypothetical protein
MASTDATVIARMPITVSMGEVTALCARLDARAQSQVGPYQPEAQADLRLAAAVIRRMQMVHHSSDVLALTDAKLA